MAPTKQVAKSVAKAAGQKPNYHAPHLKKPAEGVSIKYPHYHTNPLPPKGTESAHIWYGDSIRTLP